jgi:hypothetical protein
MNGAGSTDNASGSSAWQIYDIPVKVTDAFKNFNENTF